MGSRRPSDSRKRYLNGLAKDQQADVVRRAEEIGPAPNDVDWMIAEAAADATKAIQTASAGATDRIEASSLTASQRIEAAVQGVAFGASADDVKAAIGEAVGNAVHRLRTELSASRDRSADGAARVEARAGSMWSWALTMGAAALFVLVLAAVSLSSSVATRNRDRALARELSTPQGVAALALARANPDLASMLESCPREVDAGHTVMTCRLWPIGTRAPQAHPRISTAEAVISDWPALWLAALNVLFLVAIIVLALARRGPGLRRIWPRGR